jgi:hypothetical protein
VPSQRIRKLVEHKIPYEYRVVHDEEDEFVPLKEEKQVASKVLLAHEVHVGVFPHDLAIK